MGILVFTMQKAKSILENVKPDMFRFYSSVPEKFSVGKMKNSKRSRWEREEQQMEEKEFSKNRKNVKKRKRKKHSAKMNKRAYRRLLIVNGVILTALVAVVCILLFVVLFFNSDEKAAAALAQGAGLSNAERIRTITEEVLAEQAETVSTVKEVDTETDEITTGIDVSEYQGNIDWEQAADGLDFVMVRVGYRKSDTGEITEDACARYNLQEARDQGLYLGAYFFSTAVSEEEAVEEAQWVCDLLKGYPITYPVAYNCEGFQNPGSRQYELTKEERSRIAEAFLDEVEAHGYTGMFYAARNELQDDTLWDTSGLELKYRIWVAQYGIGDYPDTQKPEYTGLHAMWQYTNEGNVEGIESGVDLNVAYFGYREAAESREEGSAETVEANPEVGVNFTDVSEQVTAKEVTNLRSTMDQGSDANIVAELHNGETVLRTGTGNNGWSRVEYNGQTLYAVSSLLTTDLSYTPPVQEPESEFKTKFTTVSENVTAKEVTNLRNRPSVEEPSQVIAQLYHGEVVVRTGISDVGWSRVEYNGQTLYCISSYLQAAE